VLATIDLHRAPRSGAKRTSDLLIQPPRVVLSEMVAISLPQVFLRTVLRFLVAMAHYGWN
jgi:hypothetical protein